MTRLACFIVGYFFIAALAAPVLNLASPITA
jgi:hypothetical protein